MKLRTVTIDRTTCAEVRDDKPVYVAMTRRSRVWCPGQPAKPARCTSSPFPFRLLRRSGWNDLAHWTSGAYRSRVPFRAGGASGTPRTCNARIALRTGRSHGTNIPLGSNGACVSFGAGRTGRASISFRANWSRITLGAGGSDRPGAPSRSDGSCLPNGSCGTCSTCVTLRTSGSHITLRTSRPGKQLHCINVGGSGSAKGVHDRSAGDAVPDQQEDEENQGPDKARQHSADPPFAIHWQPPVWSKPVTAWLSMHLSLLSLWRRLLHHLCAAVPRRAARAA